MIDIKNGRFSFEKRSDLLELANKKLVFIINNKPKKLTIKLIGELVVLFDNDIEVSQSHYEWFSMNKSLVFTNVIACENYLKDERECEIIAEALYDFRGDNGH